MKLTVFNGSPRALKGSTAMFLGHFLDGFASIAGNTYEETYLARPGDLDKAADLFRDSECVLIGFPLYSDAMPAQVMSFIESLAPLCQREINPSVAFLVQSGFPEANHSRYLERYLEKLAARLHSKYLGTIVKGAGNRMDLQPRMMTKPVFKRFRKLGTAFGETGELDPGLLTKIAQPEKLKGVSLWMLRLMVQRLPALTGAGWNKLLKANNAYDKRFDAPYV